MIVWAGNYAIQMDWIRRLMVTLGFARGLQYLHELADPLIIYKDVKSNILLDECMTAKVADFGLFKLFGDTDQKVYVTTKVKGTMHIVDFTLYRYYVVPIFSAKRKLGRYVQAWRSDSSLYDMMA
ncbi:probable leucine-rich repeat receptor-like protein kinase At5g49770 [Chenopodium quinoa]|uniref:probable leucine-rich repeat receptor-like protein kinase At5g49770 n=1 Tax=Chenopodium quinoa TaxID=63459 RepID=UPI000B79076E|nr:probable leucine-rich repeat receptor-like protein kinase At5g49770 [Chenopodium quinoa]